MAAMLVAVGAAALAAWVAVLAHPARPWDLRPRDGDAVPPPPAWPGVCVLVPAHDEADVLPRTLPALLAQDYPGEWRAILVDDRSGDATREVAQAAASAGSRLTVVAGGPLPPGWVGKVWALEQGLTAAGAAEYVLLTDADILHDPTSLRRLVAESEAGALALNSRMARLHVGSRIEKLLVPPFVFFFALLYPMRWVNGGRVRLAAAAGGCILLRRDALDAIGGFGAIRGAVIDDVALARAVKRQGLRIRLATSEEGVRSLRAYGTLAAFWRTVRRTAFTQLGHSWPLLALATLVLALVFAGPPLALVLGAARGTWLACALGAAAWIASGAAYLTTARFYGVRAWWALTLPLAGALYGAMTIDSALVHARGARGAW